MSNCQLIVLSVTIWKLVVLHLKVKVVGCAHFSDCMYEWVRHFVDFIENVCNLLKLTFFFYIKGRMRSKFLKAIED